MHACLDLSSLAQLLYVLLPHSHILPMLRQLPCIFQYFQYFTFLLFESIFLSRGTTRWNEHEIRISIHSSLKRPSHVKLMLANSCWQTQIGACERHMLANCWRKVGENRDKFYFSPTVCQHVVVSFTCTNLSLPTRVRQQLIWRVKAA